ncbi:hemerythrin domain-containing protein [Planosporangium flavigriseum]|nr:hemerythrin domain-containing protein [Planosporangium flavigriseum]
MTGDPNAPVVRRRDVLGMPAVLAGGLVLPIGRPAEPTRTGTSTPARLSPTQAKAPVTPPEDLMLEHGVLKRVLLVYREAIRRIDSGGQTPTEAVHAGAGIIRDFIENYHEHLEERYVFPRLFRAHQLTGTVIALLEQHQRGRVLTGRILDATGASKTLDTRSRHDLVTNLAAFIRMYEPHEAQEDTVIFPAFRDVVPAKEFLQLGEVFQDEGHRRFGTSGFAGIVNQVAEIEKTLGIHDLAQFTPQV